MSAAHFTRAAARFASAARSTCSAGSSSPSTSRKAEGAHRLGPAAGRNVRNVSRIVAVLEWRCTAISVSVRMIAERGSRTRTPPRPPRGPRAMSGAPNCATSCFGQRLDRGGAIVVARFDDLHQGRPAERSDAEKSAAERRARLALRASRIGVGEHERARHRPLARLRRALEHEGVGRIEPDGAQELHRPFGPPRLRIEPGRLGQRRDQRSPLDIGLARSAAPADRRCRRCRGAPLSPAASRVR